MVLPNEPAGPVDIAAFCKIRFPLYCHPCSSESDQLSDKHVDQEDQHPVSACVKLALEDREAGRENDLTSGQWGCIEPVD